MYINAGMQIIVWASKSNHPCHVKKQAGQCYWAKRLPVIKVTLLYVLEYIHIIEGSCICISTNVFLLEVSPRLIIKKKVKHFNCLGMAKERSTLFRVHFSTLSNIVAGLPFFATLFCVTWSVVFNFKESTATHCRVKLIKMSFGLWICVW